MKSEAASLEAEVRAGLGKPQKELPSKLLWDDVGSALFEVISHLPEYGLTRAGERLVRRHADELAERLPPRIVVAELGSGSARNTRWILEAISRRQAVTYCPIDISPAALVLCRREVAHIDAVTVVGFEGLYLQGLAEVAARRAPGEGLLVLFLGGTIGNFDRPASIPFLSEVRGHLESGDRLLLAGDLMKPPGILIPAYDDPLGVTAAFDLNVLARLNREMDADFDLAKFAHEARWDEADRRIEMHLRAREAHRACVRALDLRVDFRAGETIWTESSHRFTASEMIEMGRAAGLRCEAQWIDSEWPFAQTLFVAA